MSQSADPRHSYQQYLDYERRQERKHEYLAGYVYAMAGGTAEHDALAANLIRLLGNALADKRCAVHGSDLKLRIEDVDVATYADVVVICDSREYSQIDSNAITNARLIIEVTSPSSEAYDRGEKFEHYRRMPSLGAYVLVAHERELVEVYERKGDEWRLAEARAAQRLRIESLDVALEVSEVYRDPLGGSLARPDSGREPVRP